jgi:benzoylformate decarboxylase
VRAQDVPGAIARAAHEATTHRGPAIVIVPMDDWGARADPEREDAAPERVVRAAAADTQAVEELAAFLEAAETPALVVGAGTDDLEPWAAIAELAQRLPQREGQPPEQFRPPPPPEPPSPGEPLLAGHVLSALAERLPRNTVIVEEAPVDRPELHERLLAREPLGFLSAAMGGLGFALPAATGVRMALPERPVVAVVGDGSAMYGIQALWSAAHYRVGVVFVILSNGGYAIMDRLVERHGSKGPWPGFDVDIAGIARAQGCDARSIAAYDDLTETLDEVVPELATREEPLLLDVAIAPTSTFEP